jgi:hypothetical protein
MRRVITPLQPVHGIDSGIEQARWAAKIFL